MQIDTTTSYATLHSQRITSGSVVFTVPKSALRADGSSTFGRSVGQGTLACDSFEISGATANFGAVYGPPMAGMRQEQSLYTPGTGKGGGITSGTGSGSDDDSLTADSEEAKAGETSQSGDGGAAGKSAAGGEGEALSEEEKAQVDKLKQRDMEVRAHEAAHQSVGGQYAGAMSLEYQQGPDGRRYAVGGEVSIDISAESDPEATIAKMQQVRAAALAPAEPSGQDQSVAAQATKLEAQARQEANQADAEEAQSTDGAEGADGSKSGETGTATGTNKSESDQSGDESGNAGTGVAAAASGMNANASTTTNATGATSAASGSSNRIDSPAAAVGASGSMTSLSSGSAAASIRQGGYGQARYGRMPIDIYA